MAVHQRHPQTHFTVASVLEYVFDPGPTDANPNTGLSVLFNLDGRSLRGTSACIRFPNAVVDPWNYMLRQVPLLIDCTGRQRLDTFSPYGRDKRQTYFVLSV